MWFKIWYALRSDRIATTVTEKENLWVSQSHFRRATSAEPLPQSHFLRLIASCVVAWVMCGILSAQHVFHLYVDANYGDDLLAFAQNPRMPTSGSPSGVLGPHRTDPMRITGKLTQAPYSFRTINGPKGALFYLTTLGSMPLVNLNTGETVEFVVIHVLPGIYSPQPGIDPDSGLPRNQDVFPIYLPDRVSVQGTSALDTVFDASHMQTSVFHVGQSASGALTAYEGCFIDGITIRGARGTYQENPSVLSQGAGVLIHMEVDVRLAITNCFFTDNNVGVAIVCDDPQWAITRVHRPRIVHNTFAFNQIGVWNGAWKKHGEEPLSRGENRPFVANNVFDPSTPNVGARPGTRIGISAFEGLSADDTTTTVGVMGVDSNAYEQNAPVQRHNLGDRVGGTPAIWPLTTVRHGVGGTPLALPSMPAVDIAPFTNPPSVIGNPSVTRGSLYIADIFRIESPSGIPRSRHDFRLCPEALMSNSAIAGVTNPLVNAGIDLSQGFVQQNLSTAGGLGIPANYEPAATLHGLDWDCDGFGNKRIAAKDSVSTGLYGDADIGADEMGALIISGYLDSTRIFSRPHSVMPIIPDRTDVYYFNLVTSAPANPGPTYLRPWYGVALDLQKNFSPTLITSQWYDQLLFNPYMISGQNYTPGNIFAGASSVRYKDVVVLKVNNPFMRNLRCDIAPHLYHHRAPEFLLPQTWYPNWSYGPPFSDTFAPFSPLDPFQANPWFDQKYQIHVPKDNDRLFKDSLKNLRLGIISPPQTVVQGDMFPESYLFNTIGLSPAHIMGSWFDPFYPMEWAAPQTWIYTVNQHGWAHSSSTLADVVPRIQGQDWQGLRINAELIVPNDAAWQSQWGDPVNNLQTFLIVQGPVTGDDAPLLDWDLGTEGQGASSSNRSSSGTSRETQLKALRAKIKELSQRKGK